LLFKKKGWNVAATMRSPEKAKSWTGPASLFTPRLDVTDRVSMQVLVLYLKRPRAKSGELRHCGGALRIQRLEGSRPAGLWDLYLDGAVLIVCERAVAVRSLGFQERVAERTGVGKRIRESESHHHTAF